MKGDQGMNRYMDSFGRTGNAARGEVRSLDQIEDDRDWATYRAEIEAWDAEIADDIAAHEAWVRWMDRPGRGSSVASSLREYTVGRSGSLAQRRSFAGSCRETMSAGGICGLPVMDNDPVNLFCTDHSMKRYEAAVERDQERMAYLSCHRHEECDGEPCIY